MTMVDALYGLAGGALIGLAATGLLLFNGRIAGISGLFAGLLGPEGLGRAFVAGLIVAGIVMSLPMPNAYDYTVPRSISVLAIGGLLVGFGTRLGSGCTSGHGVCGLSRLSGRSLAATLVFIGAGIAAVTALRVLLGGAS